ncbi:ParB family protein [Paraburkholderia sp. BL23I1N1]|uniref:ParB/RepB/Spo0J family partition protein n=1 Tax=Paraburkholderia sp. BL23I1N1 TaxID=1938802 RepID=UPI000FF341DD|nr:ParB/RepB/Spo0J family partition protein [Paraburkholderia sp. BL23I1N1]RKE23750.1 ParB family protein [Paraburkholderia sp. BL23I1N1]
MNIRARMAEQTANLRAASDIPKDEVTASRQTNDKPKTGPGMAAALAAANIKIQELEARGAQSVLPVSEIVPNPWQPRRVFNEAKLAELAESIREVGLLQPIVVRRAESAYQIVAGERRWRSHKLVGLEEIKVLVVNCTDQDMAVLALVENIGRDDLADYEISISIRRTEKEFPNRTRLAEAVGMSRRGLYRYLAFDTLPAFITSDLDINPTLIGGNAADAIANVIKKHGEKAVAAARELWPEVVSGNLDQGKYAPAIAALVGRRVSSKTARERSIEKFFAGKNHAGSITKDVNSFTVKIKTGVLSDAQETRIRQVISELFNGAPLE